MSGGIVEKLVGSFGNGSSGGGLSSDKGAEGNEHG
jgi:hypothetical protein